MQTNSKTLCLKSGNMSLYEDEELGGPPTAVAGWSRGKGPQQIHTFSSWSQTFLPSINLIFKNVDILKVLN